MWRRNQTAAALAHPENFADVARHVITFADPLIYDQIGNRYYDAAGRGLYPVIERTTYRRRGMPTERFARGADRGAK